MHSDCILSWNLLFLPPPFLPIDAETDAAATEFDYTPDEQPTDDQPFSAELLGKQNHFDHHISPTLPSLILALDLPYNCSVSSYSNA